MSPLPMDVEGKSFYDHDKYFGSCIKRVIPV